MFRWFWVFGGSFANLSAFRRFCKLCFFLGAISMHFVDTVEFRVVSLIWCALQGLFCISVSVALVWIHSATASAVSFFCSFVSNFATMSFWIFCLMARHLFFQPFCVSFSGGSAVRLSKKQHGLTCFLLSGSTSTSCFVFVFSALSCLTSSVFFFFSAACFH